MPVIRHSNTKAEQRRKRVRSKMSGTEVRPRVTVFRSNKGIYLQAIDDSAGKTIVAAHTKQVVEKAEKGKEKGKKAASKTENTAAAAKKLAADLKKKKIAAVIFDRGANKYHGRVKAVAETLRSEGITV